MGPSRYFVFNKKRDYQSGYLQQVEITERGIRLEGEAVRSSGIFISALMDSGIEGNAWHRAVIESTCYGDDSIRFYFYCSDSRQISIYGQDWDWDDLIRTDTISAQRKHALMQPYLAHRIFHPQDILLYHARGRYLWMEIQMLRQAEVPPEILHMKIYAENSSFVEYLPEIFQKGDPEDFLRRYLSLFETVYQDLDARIRSAARQLDPQAADPEFLYWIADWVGISNAYLWPADKLRRLLVGIVKRNLLRGTRAYMEYMITVFAGEAPYFVEYSDIRQFYGTAGYEALKQCYAYGPYEVNVLVREQAAGTPRKVQTLKKIIDSCRPAHIEVHLIILRPYIYLGQNAYLGINSTLGTYQQAYLNGVALVPSVLGAGSHAQQAGGMENEGN